MVLFQVTLNVYLHVHSTGHSVNFNDVRMVGKSTLDSLAN